MMIELAFLRGFLAWEVFIEESFLLYMMGKRPLRGRPPHRYVLPPNRQAAAVLAAESRAHAKWDAAAEVSSRAERFFRDGRPYIQALRPNQHALDDAKTIRNAVAHKSAASRQRFEALVRKELTTLPPSVDVGAFLNTTKPGITPPISFLDHYLDKLQAVAEQIAAP
jgi:hypothetical protein